MKTICRSLQDVKNKLNTFFAPDVTFKFKEGMYVVTPVTEPGEIWLKNISGIKVGEKDKMCSTYQIDYWLNSAQRCGLTTQVEDNY